MSELISSKDALIALANGDEVEFENPFRNTWVDIKSLTITEIEGGYYICSDDDTKVKTQFRLKPRTIMIGNIEVPAPFEPKNKEVCFYFDYLEDCGFSELLFDSKNKAHHKFIQFGAWRTEKEVKQVVAALRQIFK